jgi:acetolactate synthase-1/2/3 large subunit
MENLPVTTGADIIAQALYKSGVRYAFGIPGGEVLALVDALVRTGIQFVIARHENAAGFMAEGAYRATGAPGVLVATVGPGVANGLNSVANAAQERVPLIVLTGKVPEEETLTYTHQIFDHQAALRPFVKASFEARIGACDLVIDKAVAIATSNRPGAVHIDLPIPVANADHAPHRSAPDIIPAPLAPASSIATETAQKRFSAAERPIMVAGQDLLNEEGGPDAVAAFATKHNIPVVTTYKAKGVLAEEHSLSLGGHGLSPKSDAIILPLLAQSDCVICAGYDPIEMRMGWRDPFAPGTAISFVQAQNDHFMHREDILITVPSAQGLVLFDGLEPTAVWPDGAPAKARADLSAAFGQTDAWTPASLYHTLNDALPRDIAVTVDSGAHRILWSQIMTCTRPNQLLQSTGLCTMGCALPLATGHALASGKPVVAVMGDGCLDMVLGELATLRDLALPVTVVVVVDGSYSLIAHKQRGEGYQSAGVDFGVTDYAATAQAMGIASSTARDAEALRDTVQDAIHSGKPTLIAVPMPRGAYHTQI